jgi:hypothetical protein
MPIPTSKELQNLRDYWEEMYQLERKSVLVYETIIANKEQLIAFLDDKVKRLEEEVKTLKLGEDWANG